MKRDSIDDAIYVLGAIFFAVCFGIPLLALAVAWLVGLPRP